MEKTKSNIMHKLIFILLICVNYVNAQNYGDQFLPVILEGSKEHLAKYNTFLRFKDSVKIENKKIIENRSTLPLSYVDSLSKHINYNFFFDDSIFHLKRNVLLIDTLYFFSQNYFKSDKINFIVHRNLNYANYKSEHIITDTIILRGVSVYKDFFLIVLQHTQSDYEVQFRFKLIGFLPPKLTHIFRYFRIIGHKYRWDEFLDR